MPAVFTHDNAELLGGRQDVVTTTNSIDASVSQYTTYLTVGVTDRFDISAALKFVTNDLKVRSDASIQRIGTTNELTHFYRLANGNVGTTRDLLGARSRVRAGRHRDSTEDDDRPGEVARRRRRVSTSACRPATR